MRNKEEDYYLIKDGDLIDGSAESEMEITLAEARKMRTKEREEYLNTTIETLLKELKKERANAIGIRTDEAGNL